ncbi:MAG: hypothetical protein JO356_17185 [Acidobacteria bacterium]|nr:hypothetical protein [Acidobacteriota bacterium]
MAQSYSFLIEAEKVPAHPYWPAGDSGITMGVGWDLGQHNRTELVTTWSQLGSEDLALLEGTIHKKGKEAQILLPKVQNIDVPVKLSLALFRESLASIYYPMMIKLFPGAEKLQAEVQVALVSLVFNRGNTLGHDPDWRTAKELDRRWEIRRLQDDVKRGDLFAIYIRLGTMKRLWEHSNARGLLYRRRDEQHLIRPLVDKELHWQEDRDKLKEAGLPPCHQ